MDPLGLGLENFDPIGRWRTEVAGSPVDSSGVTPAGESFQTPAELKKVLLSHKAEFVRNVTEKMLGYALGRGLEYYDQPTVQAICDSLQKNDDRSSTLILEIVKSYPFRYRRNATADDAGSKDSATDGRSEGKEKRTTEAQSGCVKSQGTGTLSFGSYVELVLTIWLSVTRSLRMQAVTTTLKALPR
jgi:hypothetical protein